MERFPVEILYVLAFVGFILFNFLTQQAAARRRQREAQARAGEAPEAAPDLPADPRDEPLEDIWGRIPTPAQAAAPLPVAAAVPVHVPAPHAPKRLHPVRALLKDKRDLRRAVVLMMVLGPCRAQEPPEEL